jgi:uncharacterized protein YqcC (DUF446 family)
MDAPPTAQSVFDRMRAKADEIEAELKRIGYWQQQPLPAEKLQFKRAFGADTMSFPQWLQFVFLPRARDVAAKRAKAPDASTVGAYAVRELDGDPKADQLVSLLSEFDALFGTPKVFLGAGAGTAVGRLRGRWSAPVLVVVWTAFMIAAGVLFALLAPRLVAKSHQAIYSFSVQQPSSGAYESIDLSATAEGRGGERAGARDLHLRMFVQQSPVAGSDMTVDPAAGTFHYGAPGSGADSRAETTGKFDADALVNWMRRFGIGGDETKLTAEANALIAFTEQVRRDPAAAFAARQATPAAAGEPFQLSPINHLERDLPSTTPNWIWWAIPVAVWLVGLAVILLLRRAKG